MTLAFCFFGGCGSRGLKDTIVPSCITTGVLDLRPMANESSRMDKKENYDVEIFWMREFNTREQLEDTQKSEYEFKSCRVDFEVSI